MPLSDTTHSALNQIPGNMRARRLSIIATYLGWLLCFAGLFLLIGYDGFSLSRSSMDPLWNRLGILGLTLGLVILFALVLFQRLKARKTDSYKNIND